jgi:hypothetical protein
MINREDVPRQVKQLLVNSGLVNKRLDSKVDYFYGPYKPNYINSQRKTMIEKALITQLMECNKKLPKGTPKKEKWVAILEHISKYNNRDFKTFLSRLEPNAFPYLRELIKKSYTTGIPGGQQTTKLPPIEDESNHRCFSVGADRKSSDNEDFGEEILNVMNYKIMQDVADQTKDPLVAPIVHVLRNTKDFIHDEVTTSIPMSDQEQAMRDFKEYKTFLKRVALGSYVKTKQMLTDIDRQDKLAYERMLCSKKRQRKPRSKFSDNTICSAARGLGSIVLSRARRNRASNYRSMKRTFTQKFKSCKLFAIPQRKNFFKLKTRKETAILKTNEYSEGSISDAE